MQHSETLETRLPDDESYVALTCVVHELIFRQNMTYSI